MEMFDNVSQNAMRFFESWWHYAAIFFVLTGIVSMLLSKKFNRIINEKKEGSYELYFKVGGWFLVAAGAVLSII